MAQMGRKAIFPKKTVRLSGWISMVGAAQFERARKRLATLAGVTGTVSDGDVAEYLARGHEATKKFLGVK